MLAAVSNTARLQSGATASILHALFGISRPLSCPRLPPLSSSHPVNYTVILDLDETLLHTEWLQGSPERYVVHERPFVREFLRSLKSLPVEVVIFTAGIQGYADTVINIMDSHTRTVHYRRYRQHTTVCAGHRWKDLSLLNRDLSRTLIVDNSPEVFLRQPDNGLVIASWEGHSPMSREPYKKEFCVVEDFALLNLFYWLEYMCMKKLSVPEFIRTHRDVLKKAVGYGLLAKAPAHYKPPFPLGPASRALVERCFRTLQPAQVSDVKDFKEQQLIMEPTLPRYSFADYHRVSDAGLPIVETPEATEASSGLSGLVKNDHVMALMHQAATSRCVRKPTEQPGLIVPLSSRNGVIRAADFY